MTLGRRVLLLASAFGLLGAHGLQAAEVRILFSSSLNGNLDGCTCSVQPISGLVKRGAFVEAYRRRFPEALLVDTGDMLLDPQKMVLNRAIFHSYALLRYDAVGIGDQDLGLGSELIRAFGSSIPIVTSNTWVKGAFLRPDVRLARAEVSLQRAGANVRIVGIIHPDALRFSRSPAKNAFRFTDSLAAIRAIPAADLLIVLSHSGQELDRDLGRRLGRPALLFGGHDQVLLEKPVSLGNGVSYFQPGRDGDRLGEVVIKTKGGGAYRIISHRLHRFDSVTSPDHPEIRRLIRGLNGH